MSAKLSGKVIVVTGASAGVGRAVALRVARRGARVGLIAREAGALTNLRQEIESTGAKAHAVAVDVANADRVDNAASEIESALGPIDIWINNAMVTIFAPVHRLKPDEIDRVTSVAYLGAVHGTLAALARMRERGRGHIIQIGSALAYCSIPLQSAYCGAKHALRGFTAAMRTELLYERSALKLSILELPAMNTPQFDWARTRMAHEPRPMGQIYQPDVAADAVECAIEQQGWDYSVGRSTLMTVLASAISPAFLYRYLAKTAYTGQETSTPVAPDRRDNLLEPVAGLHRTHGAFDDGAKPRALIVRNQVARLSTICLGAAFFFIAGMLF